MLIKLVGFVHIWPKHVFCCIFDQKRLKNLNYCKLE